MIQRRTAQETFDFVINHLRQQGRSARRESGSCAYRGKDGTTCAVGCLIPDDDYDVVIEGHSVWGLLKPDESVKNHLKPEVSSKFQDLFPSDLDQQAGGNFLTNLQRLHDYSLGTPEAIFEDEVRHIAKLYSLTYTEPTP